MKHVDLFQGRNCLDNFTSCLTEIEDTMQTYYFTQPEYTDTGTTRPRIYSIRPGVWQGSY